MDSFERDGVVSIWAFREAERPANAEKDVLKDLCGVDYYDIDSTEGVTSDIPKPFGELLSRLSYADSFINGAMKAAEDQGIGEAFGVIAQYDFAYEESKIKRPVAKDPVFIGYFGWHD